jgi:hypothetical protein
MGYIHSGHTVGAEVRVAAPRLLNTQNRRGTESGGRHSKRKGISPLAFVSSGPLNEGGEHLFER